MVCVWYAIVYGLNSVDGLSETQVLVQLWKEEAQETADGNKVVWGTSVTHFLQSAMQIEEDQ